MLRYRAVPLVLSAGLLWGPGTAMAQQIDSLAALKELAAVLLTGGTGDAVLRIGHAGAALPPEVIEPGAKVLGSLEEGSVTRTVLVVPGTPDVTQRRLEDRLMAAGWVRPVFPIRYAKGFAPEPLASSQLCKGDGSLRANATTRSGGESLVVLYFIRGRGTECDAARRYAAAVHPESYERNPMPPLYPPYGVRMEVTGGGGSGGDSWHSSASLETRRAPEDLLAHYAGQLRSAGWSEGERSKTGSFIAQVWQYTDSTATKWSGLFIIAAPPEVVRRDLVFTIGKAQ